MTEPAELDIARSADADSFAALVQPYRRELRAHCYRITGSVSEADDAVQESLIRAWKGLGAFEGRCSLRTWLYRIATRACLTRVKRSRRWLPSDLGAASDPRQPPAGPRMEPIWLEPCPDTWFVSLPVAPDARITARESVALAFLAILQHLPPLQRGVLILRDVLGWSAAQTAKALETTVPAVNSALQRARATLEARRQEPHATPEDAAIEALLQRYIAAWESGDAQALAALLREDALLTMPPVPTWFSGRDAVLVFLGAMLPVMGEFRLQVTRANGAPALAAWARAPGETIWRASALHVLTCQGGGIARMDVFMNPAIFDAFGLPVEVR